MQGDAHPTKIAVRERRERVVAQLTESFARDEIGIEAFETRIDAAFCCQTGAEFDELVADLRHPDDSEGAAMVVAQTELVQDEGMAGVREGSLARVASPPVLRALFSNIERCDQSAMPRG